MKQEKIHFYALTIREERAAQDACNRITADSPEKLGFSDAQFDAGERAACALARPVINTDKKVLILTAFEFDELF